MRLQAPQPLAESLSVVVLARLAVCRSIQGQGIARALLADAFERVLMASEQIGVCGLVVHAASPAAREFYLHMGFDPSPSDPNMLLLRLVAIGDACRQHQVPWCRPTSAWSSNWPRSRENRWIW